MKKAEKADSVSAKIIEDALGETPDIPAMTLARRLYALNPGVWPTMDACRTAVRYRLGQNGHENRKGLVNKAHKRPARNPADDWTQYLPESWDDSQHWKPARITPPARILILADMQVPFHDPAAIEIAIQHGKTWGADTVVLNGDIMDHYAQSDFVTDPRLRDFPSEVRLGRQMLRTIRKAFPDARIIYKIANHEERYERYMRVKAPELLGIPEFSWENALGVDDVGIEVVKDKRPIRAGGVDILHGHEFPVSGVWPAKMLYDKYGGNAIAGHVHRTSQYSKPTKKTGVLVSCWTTGCLCGLRPEWLRHNDWNQGFATLEITRKSFRVENLRIVDGRAW